MKNSKPLLYAAAATIWVVLGFLSGNVVYLCLAAVFYVLALRSRKNKDDGE